MPDSFTNIESVIQEATCGFLNFDSVQAFCVTQNMNFDDFCNSVALMAARRFNDLDMTYEDADGVMNAISGLMSLIVTRQANTKFLIEPAWSIYLAFDAGEYPHGNSTNPIEDFTKPLIKQILGET